MSDTTRIVKKRRIETGTIALAVGENLHDLFTVHESVIKESSDFFRAALNKQWKEGVERKIELPDDTVEVVAAYVEWLYSGKVATKTDTPDTVGTEYTLLARLYVFGEKVQDDTFCNTVMRAIAELVRAASYPNSTFVKIIYEGTPATSPARALAVHLFKYVGLQGWMDLAGWKDQLVSVPEFLFDLSRAFMTVTRTPSETAKVRNVKGEDWFKKK